MLIIFGWIVNNMKGLSRSMFDKTGMENSSREVRLNNDIHNIGIRIEPNHPTNYDWIPLTFLNLVIQSAFIPNTKQLSTLLIANAGLGKTSKLDPLRQLPFVKWTLDITPKHLMDFLRSVERGDKKFLVIPDYISTLGHAKKTVELARSIFRSMMEEGITEVDIFGMELQFKDKVKAGLISGITPEFFNENTRVWKSDGFLQRFLPFSYSHSPKSKQKVLDNIRDKIDSIGAYNFKIITDNVNEPTRTIDIDNRIRLLAYQVLDKNEPPYRMYLQLIALCNASAVLRNSLTVEEIDIELVTVLSNYINRGQNPL